VALGNGSLLNHADKANSGFYFNYQKRLLCIKARRDIDPGQEIATN
jgi:SET domain-containing protein